MRFAKHVQGCDAKGIGELMRLRISNHVQTEINDCLFADFDDLTETAKQLRITAMRINNPLDTRFQIGTGIESGPSVGGCRHSSHP
jgi:hypothetical protein